MIDIPNNLAILRKQIADCEKNYAREQNAVKLLAVSKGQSVEKIKAAIVAGQTAFGENYLQEALPKITALKELSLEWHFLGPLQSNKTKKIAEHFSWIHTVTDYRNAKRLSEQRPDTLPALNICLQVNISNEASKSGLAVDEVLSVASQCALLPKIHLRGLMTIPARKTQFAEQCIDYQRMRDLFNALYAHGFDMDTLSMGMSDDFEAAIASGSTLIRIGTALFKHKI